MGTNTFMLAEYFPILLFILVGLGVILFAIVLTGLYVRRANGEFDDRLRALIAETGE